MAYFINPTQVPKKIDMNDYCKRLLDEVFEIANSNEYSIYRNKVLKGFNIFKVLRFSRYEVKTHTPFLAELLNPDGSHQQKELFLKEFIEQLKISSKSTEDSRSQFFESFSCEGAEVRSEFPMEREYKNENTWGNIDIRIENKEGKSIIIENKLYAGDQAKQIARYYNYGKAKYQENNFCLIYLTLDGKIPGKNSVGDLDERNIKTISYSQDIIEWLTKSEEKLETVAVSEIVSQYINLIRSLTNKIMNDKMKSEVADQLIRDKKTFEAAYYINESLSTAKDKIINNLFKNIAKDHEIDVSNSITGETHSSKIWFSKEEWGSQFCFCFAEKNFGHFWIGIAKNPEREKYEGDERVICDKIKNKMEEADEFDTDMPESSQYDYAWQGYAKNFFKKDWDRLEWDRLEVWSDILSVDNNPLKDNIKKLIENISTVLDEVYERNF